MKLQNVSRKYISYVELKRDGKTPIGISVKDGTKYGLRPLIKNIKHQSLSHRSHCVAEGDVILSVCGEDSKGMSKKEIRRRLKEAGFCIELKLEYEIREACFDNFGIYRYERMSLDIKKESGSFGFILRKNDSADSATVEYPTITNVRPGGPADKEKCLKDGDRLLKIDDQSLSWLSLQDISEILRNKEKATFLVEYNTGIVDFCIQVGEKTEIEIDCPDTNLGMVLGSSTEDCKIFIQEIRQGSLAQRCGAFHVGDVILQINDIDTALLTVSKANSLLQRFRKDRGKIVFIPQVREEQLRRRLDTRDTEAQKENKFSNTYSRVDHLPVPNTRHSRLKNQSASCCKVNQQTRLPSIPNSPQIAKYPTFNSPSSLHKEAFDRNNLSQTSVTTFDVHEFQTKTISMFRDILQNISNIQHFISHFDHEAERIAEKDVDTSEKYESHVTQNYNVDYSRFSQLKAIYTQMKNSAYAFSMHLVRNLNISPGDGNSSPTVLDINANNNTVTIDLIHHILGDLTEINLKQFISKSCVNELIARLDAVELDCWECRKSCLSASILTQKILLLLSFNEPDSYMGYVIRMFTENLVKLKIPCDDCKRPWRSVSQAEEQPPFVEKISQKHISPVNPMSSINRKDKKPLNIESPITSISAEPSIGVDLKTGSAYYNPGRSDLESNFIHEVDSNSPNIFQNRSILLSKHSGTTQNHLQRNANCDWMNRSESAVRKIHKEKGLVQVPIQTHKSSETISAGKHRFETSNLTKAKSVSRNVNVSEERWQVTDLPFGRTAGHPSPVSAVRSEIEERSLTSDTDIRSACSIHAKDETITNTESSTTVVRLVNDGSGFGLNFEFNALPDGRPMCPVITAVHPESAADKSGVILKGDRVLEINGRNLVGLACPKIEAIMKLAFSASEVILKMEFDITVPEIKFGTFDVRIDKNIKPGLQFKEFQKAAPLVVEGVVKGSAAHRSGLLFPGDEILFTKCIRQESYESCTCVYERSEWVVFTVSREQNKDPQDAEPETDIDYETIPSGPRGSISEHFILHRTLFRTIKRDRDRVVEYELTLFKDPIHKDFGFLVGQNPDSGKVYITGIKPGGPADKSEVIKKNDRILEVNGTIIERYNKNYVLSIFMQDNDRIDLITRRVVQRQT